MLSLAFSLPCPTLSPSLPLSLPPSLPTSLPPSLLPSLPPSLPPSFPPSLPPSLLPPSLPPSLPPLLPPSLLRKDSKAPGARYCPVAPTNSQRNLRRRSGSWPAPARPCCVEQKFQVKNYFFSKRLVSASSSKFSTELKALFRSSSGSVSRASCFRNDNTSIRSIFARLLPSRFTPTVGQRSESLRRSFRITTCSI